MLAELTLGVAAAGFFLVGPLPDGSSASFAPLSELRLEFAASLDITGQRLVSDVFALGTATLVVAPQIGVLPVAASGRLRIGDPVGAVVIDSEGRRPGFDPQLGVLTEIPGSVYFGGADGIGYIPADNEGPFTIELNGVGDDYFVQFSSSRPHAGGIELSGTLAVGEEQSQPFDFLEFFRNFGIVDLLEIDSPVVTLDLVLDISPTGVTIGPNSAIGVSAAQAALFPNLDTPEVDGLIAVTDFAGNIDLVTGALHLEAGTATLDVDGVLTATAAGLPDADNPGQTLPGIEFTFDPTNTDPAAVVGALRGLTVSLDAAPDIPTSAAKINEIVIRRNGFDIDGSIGDPTTVAQIGDPPLVELTGPQVTLDLSVTFVPEFVVSGSIGLSAASAVLLPGQGSSGNGLATLAAVGGSIDLAGNISLSFDELDAIVGDFGTLHAEGGSVHVGPDASGLPLIEVDTATLRATLLGGPIDVVIEDFAMNQAGEISFTRAGLRSDDLFDRFGLGDIVPVDLSRVDLVGVPGPGGSTLPVRLDRFRVEVEGSVDFSALAFADQTSLEPSLEIGGLTFDLNGADMDLAFTFDQGDLTVNLDGPVVFDLGGIELAGATADLTVFLGAFVDGRYVLDAEGDVGFDLDVAVEGDDPFEVSSQGRIRFDTPVDGHTTLDLDVGIEFDFDTGTNPLASLRLEDFAASFDMGLTLDSDFRVVDSHIALSGATATRLEIRIGAFDNPLVKFTAANPVLDFANPSLPLASFTDANGASLSLSFPALDTLPPPPQGSGFDALTGTVRNLDITKDARFVALDDFAIEVNGLPSKQAFGIPDWFPLTLTGIGLQIGQEALDGENLADITLLLTGGLDAIPGPTPESPPIWPISATLDDVPVSIQKLVDGDLLGAIDLTEASGFQFGIEPFKIADALEVGGTIGLHSVDDGCGEPALYAEVSGFFSLADEAGGSSLSGEISLVVSQFGPILAKVSAPTAIPLGPTGLILRGVTGGVAFGEAKFLVVEVPDDVQTADEVRAVIVKQLLGNETTFNPIAYDPAVIEANVIELARANEGCASSAPPGLIWGDAFTMALAGHFTTAVSPGILTGDLNMGAEIARQDVGITVLLSKPAERDLRVEYTLSGGTAIEGQDWTDRDDGIIIISQGSTSGSIPIRILGDMEDEENESFDVRIDDAFYVQIDAEHPDGQRLTGLLDPKVAPPSFGDYTARYTIVDDELGPPTVNIIAGFGACDAEAIVDEGADNVVSGQVGEGAGIALAICAENLGPTDSVRLEYSLRNLDSSLTTATYGGDFFLGNQGTRGIITLIGSTPRFFNIAATQDVRYELDERFEIEFSIDRSARDAADTDLLFDVARVTIDNDDLDMPPGALMFYDFDALLPGGDPYRYDNRADYTDDRVWATPFVHRDD